jgi:hypothetical protein
VRAIPACVPYSGTGSFGYIHPYPDGNGRMARFLMNAMLASGDYPWIVVRVEDRNAYLAALDRASIDINSKPFAAFIAERAGWSISRWVQKRAPEVRNRKADSVMPLFKTEGQGSFQMTISPQVLALRARCAAAAIFIFSATDRSSEMMLLVLAGSTIRAIGSRREDIRKLFLGSP